MCTGKWKTRIGLPAIVRMHDGQHWRGVVADAIAVEWDGQGNAVTKYERLDHLDLVECLEGMAGR